MKLLVIEDSKTQLNLFEKVIKREFFDAEILLAPDALEGYVLLKTVPGIDLVILDMTIPFISGREFLKKIKKVPEMAPIPVLIASGSDNLEEYLIAKLAVDTIQKPFQPSELCEKIQTILDS